MGACRSAPALPALRGRRPGLGCGSTSSRRCGPFVEILSRMTSNSCAMAPAVPCFHRRCCVRPPKGAAHMFCRSSRAVEGRQPSISSMPPVGIRCWAPSPTKTSGSACGNGLAPAGRHDACARERMGGVDRRGEDPSGGMGLRNRRILRTRRGRASVGDLRCLAR